MYAGGAGLSSTAPGRLLHRVYRSRPSIGTTLTERQADQPQEAIAVAWSTQRRLHRTWTRLEARGKRRTIIAVAAARELAGFAWSITQIE